MIFLFYFIFASTNQCQDRALSMALMYDFQTAKFGLVVLFLFFFACGGLVGPRVTVTRRSLIFDLMILQRPSSPKGCRGGLKLISFAFLLFFAAPAIYLLRLAAALAIAAPLL